MLICSHPILDLFLAINKISIKLQLTFQIDDHPSKCILNAKYALSKSSLALVSYIYKQFYSISFTHNICLSFLSIQNYV